MRFYLIFSFLTLIGILGGCGDGKVSSPDSSGTIIGDKSSFQGFYDIKKDGEVREISSDLNGNLPAMIQFVQSHSFNPSGNEELHLPIATRQIEALLLVTPDTSQITVEELNITIQLDGSQKSLEVRSPDEIFKADRPSLSEDGRPDVRYSRRAWSAVIPWDWFKPGLSITVSDDQHREGTLASAAIDWAPPAQLVINNIRLGLLA